MNPTKEELLEQAREQDIEGRSQMSKEELEEALGVSDDSDAPAAPQEDPLRPAVGSTTPKTGPVPSVTPTAVNIQSDRRFGIAANRSASRVISGRDRREARLARLRGE